METNVTLPFDGDFEALRAKLAAWGFEVGERPNAPLFARGHGVTIHAYRTGKILISGARAEEWARELRQEVGPAGPAGPSGPSGTGATQKAQQAQKAPQAPPPGWVLHFDGACMPRNPGGIAAWGFVAYKDGALVHEASGLAAPPGPGATNNVAEFTGLVEGLRWLKAQHARAPLVRGDSELVVSTMSGKKRLQAPHLLAFRDEARRLLAELDGSLVWVPREENSDADRMSRVGYENARRAHPEWRL